MAFNPTIVSYKTGDCRLQTTCPCESSLYLKTHQSNCFKVSEQKDFLLFINELFVAPTTTENKRRNDVVSTIKCMLSFAAGLLYNKYILLISWNRYRNTSRYTRLPNRTLQPTTSITAFFHWPQTNVYEFCLHASIASFKFAFGFKFIKMCSTVPLRT